MASFFAVSSLTSSFLEPKEQKEGRQVGAGVREGLTLKARARARVCVCWEKPKYKGRARWALLTRFSSSMVSEVMVAASAFCCSYLRTVSCLLKYVVRYLAEPLTALEYRLSQLLAAAKYMREGSSQVQ